MALLPAGGSATPAGRAPGTAREKTGAPPTYSSAGVRPRGLAAVAAAATPVPVPVPGRGRELSCYQHSPQGASRRRYRNGPEARGAPPAGKRRNGPRPRPPALPPPAGSGRASPGRRVTGMRKPFPGERRFRRWLGRGSRVGRTERCSRGRGPLCERRRGPQVSSCPGAERGKPRRCRAWLRWPALGPGGGRGLRSAAVPAPFPRRKLPRPFPAGRRSPEDLRAAGGGREAGAGHCPARPLLFPRHSRLAGGPPAVAVTRLAWARRHVCPC